MCNKMDSNFSKGGTLLVGLVLAFLNLSHGTSTDINDLHECGKRIEKFGPTVWNGNEAMKVFAECQLDVCSL